MTHLLGSEQPERIINAPEVYGAFSGMTSDKGRQSAELEKCRSLTLGGVGTDGKFPFLWKIL